MSPDAPLGYNGQILRVNLSKQELKTENINEKFCRKYLGGAGFITHWLWKELKPGVDALGPDNKLIFATGPVTGLKLPGSARNCVGAKSPLTGGIAKSEVGGDWSLEIKQAGFDAIIVEGKAEKPVYLWIQDGVAILKDAQHLWGKNIKETRDEIRQELGDENIQVSLIGPGGENQVRFACVFNGLHDAAGRGGLGAVMGSKNLKAVAVRGHNPPAVADNEKVGELRKWCIANMSPFLTELLAKYGTGGPEMEMWEVQGNLPIRNFRDGSFPTVKDIQSHAIKKTIWVGMAGCNYCPVRCKKLVEVKEPYTVDRAYSGPEYETLAALGSNLGIDDIKAIAKGNELCSAYTLDTMSTGGIIAFAMECFEHGLITIRDTDGIELKFGNGDAMVRMIEKIARRDGFGNEMALGIKHLIHKIGPASEEFAVHVKGMECAMHDPRFKVGMGLGYMVNAHGPDHGVNLHDTDFTSDASIKSLHAFGVHEPLAIDDISPKKVALLKFVQLSKVIRDSLVLCSFLPYHYEKLVELTIAATGWDTGAFDLFKIAERTATTARLFNLREGFTAADDQLPKRYYQPKTSGPLADKPLNPEKMEQAKSYYYTLMGWDPVTGVPKKEKVEELDIV